LERGRSLARSAWPGPEPFEFSRPPALPSETALRPGALSSDVYRIYREAMDSDRHDPIGIAFGTSRGQLFFATEAGDPWQCLAADLPSIRAVLAT